MLLSLVNFGLTVVSVKKITLMFSIIRIRMLLTFYFGKKLTVIFVLNLTVILTDRKGRPINSLASPLTKYQPDRFRFVLNKILFHSYQRQYTNPSRVQYGQKASFHPRGEFITNHKIAPCNLNYPPNRPPNNQVLRYTPYISSCSSS